MNRINNPIIFCFLGASLSAKVRNNAGHAIRPCADERLAMPANKMAVVSRIPRFIEVKEITNRLTTTPAWTRKKESWNAHNQFSLWTGEKNMRKESPVVTSQRRGFEGSNICIKP